MVKTRGFARRVDNKKHDEKTEADDTPLMTSS
jgi:hypothetical protein